LSNVYVDRRDGDEIQNLERRGMERERGRERGERREEGKGRERERDRGDDISGGPRGLRFNPTKQPPLPTSSRSLSP